MARSNITMPPKKKDTGTDSSQQGDIASEKKINDIINKGGSTTKKEELEEDTFKNFNIKILKSELESINTLRQKRPKTRSQKRPGISTHDWIIEAVKEKIERENKKYNI